MRCLIAVVGALQAVTLAQELPPNESLFDGRTLAGWRGDPAIWRVEAGSIVGSSRDQRLAANTFLVLEGREPGDFEFEALVQLAGDNNSGVQYRSRVLDGGPFRVGGYQCDLHARPEYTAMLYDEQGAGIVARHGQFVRWTDAGCEELGALRKPRALDLSQWVKLRIVAMGELVWHELDGVVVTAVEDRRSTAPHAGVLALQVHSGNAMVVRCREPKLREWRDVAAMQRVVAVPPTVVALRRMAEERPAAPAGADPMWIWDRSPEAEEERFFRRSFPLDAVPAAASLVVACDNHCRVFVNGEKVGGGDAWETPVRVNVAEWLRAGENVVAVHAWNDGGPAALAVRLAFGEGANETVIVSDGAWSHHDDDPDGWNAPGFAADGWRPVRVLGAVGQPGLPWSGVHARGALGSAVDPFTPQLAVVATEVDQLGDPWATPPVLRLCSVPGSLGSWVSLGSDGKGRLYAGAQGGGLFRITPGAAIGARTTVERVPVTIGGAHGLLWFRDALYAVVNGKESGLYRLTDIDGDDSLDRVELLAALEGEGEHGPHSVVVAPDGEHLLVVAGNQTKLPKLAASRVPTNWAEDRLLPRLDDPNPYWEGISPPGGWVCQVDVDGTNWELLTCGFRNPYDAAVLPSGQVVVFDSDMEWDLGLPWYRPTRLLAVQSGVDYGWRIGSAKWPADYPEAPPALLDIGPASPTGMASVRQMQIWSSMLALDWTFGTVYRDGRPWLVGAPLPLADVAVVGDATFLVTGGRGLPSTLLRVPYGHDDNDPPHVGIARDRRWGSALTWSPVETRSAAAILATLDGTETPAARVDARIALERLPAAAVRDAALASDPSRPTPALTGLLALARMGAPEDLGPLIAALDQISFVALPPTDRIAWLRVHALALLRLGPASAEQRAQIAARLLPLFPTGDERLDQDLAELLAYVDAPGFLDKAVPQLATLRPSPVPAWAKVAEGVDVYGSQYGGVIRAMAAAMPPVGQIAIADALRTVKHGWTLDQRRTYFEFLAAARRQKGGASYDGFLKKMIDASWETCSPAEQSVLADVVGRAKADLPQFVATPPKGPGRDWQLADVDGVLRGGLDGADLARGRNLFHAASCARCHYFAGEGGNHGPDLTSLGNKFTARDVLAAILEPSAVISDQYSGQVLTRKDGTALFGFAVKTHHGDVEVYEVMPATADAQLVRVPVADVATIDRSPLSPMPADLVDRLARDELRDLLAFLLSRGSGATVAPTGK